MLFSFFAMIEVDLLVKTSTFDFTLHPSQRMR